MTKYQANTKLRAIKLYQKGVDLNQISKELNITNANEIDHWLKRYQQQGLSGLKAKQTKTKYGGKLELNTVSGPQHNGGLGGLDPATAFTAYGSATAIPFRNGKNKEMAALKDFIQSKIEEAHKTQQTTQVTTQTDTADEIAKYKKLADNGTITQEEFEAKKKQLLNL